eukprot:TRINITY_DN67666_c14_g1_i1.p1 TRINITY_DN67666_c14_g1~~TRINITY_DN67666_c14_g1_i1.p1  ORF type:complete len:182 (+),score=11.01 TRINITY_DN67666_c14_g1_i1:36-581(+)
METKLDELWKLMGEIHKALCDKHDAIKKHEEQLTLLKQQQEPSARIVLNIGGTLFETQASVLTSERAVDSMFYAIGANWFQNDDEVFIDRDGTLFPVILNWLRGVGTVNDVLPSDTWADSPHLEREFELTMLIREAKYYGLDALVEDLSTQFRQCGQALCTLGLSSTREQYYQRVSPTRLY